MDIKQYIGETTEYDKKQEVERRKVKSWLKSVSAFANGDGGSLLFGIADVFAQLGYMERKGSGMGKIVNPIKALPYFTERMQPTFYSDRAQFAITFPNLIAVWKQEHPEVVLNDIDVPQDVPQGVPQEDDLDKWIEYQVAVFPKITTEELAARRGVTSKTIKRHIAKLSHIEYVGSGYSGHWEVKHKMED